MHLPEFVLLAISTVAAIAAGLGGTWLKSSQPNYGIIRTLFWISAFTFGSLGIVWSAASDGQPLWLQMLVSGLLGGLASAALAWGLWEIRSQEQSHPSNEISNSNMSRGPTLEA